MAALSFLLSSDAAAQRMIERKPRFVVHAEARGGEFSELDAECAQHAHNIASAWTQNGLADSAAVRRVFHDGSLGQPIRIWSVADHWD